MAKIQSIAAALPGDVIQITDRGPLFMALLLVEECRRTFTRARLAVVGADQQISWVEYRVPPQTYEVLGCVRMLEADTARARETMRATLAAGGL